MCPLPLTLPIPRRLNIRPLVAALVAGLILAPGFAGSKGKDKSAKPEPAPDLVWPGPPERPRVRFLSAISSGDDVTGKGKQSLAERLAGRAAARQRLQLQKPYGVAVDPSGRIFVADPAQRGVLVFDRAARSAASWKGSAQFPLFQPVGLAFQGEERLFVSDAYASQIVVFDLSGKAVAAFGKGALKRPAGLAVDSERSLLYVADVKADEILVYGTRDLKLQRRIGGVSKSGQFEPGTFAGPTNLALDPAGNLYVSDTLNCRIQVFNAEGKFVRLFGAMGIRPGTFVRPKGIAVDSEHHVYVVDSEFNNFQIFTQEGKPLLFVGSLGDKPGQFLLPAGLAIDRRDRIYVTEQRVTGGRVQVFEYLPDKTATSGGNRDAN